MLSQQKWYSMFMNRVLPVSRYCLRTQLNEIEEDAYSFLAPPAVIRTRFLPNLSQKHYCCALRNVNANDLQYKWLKERRMILTVALRTKIFAFRLREAKAILDGRLLCVAPVIY
jgi:hypothetical protein